MLLSIKNSGLFVLMLFSLSLSAQTHFSLSPLVHNGDYSEKTIIIKVKSIYRGSCTNAKIDNEKFIQLFSSIGGKELAKKFPMETAPVRMINAQGQALADLSLIYEFTYTADVSLEKAINRFIGLGLFEYVEPHYIPHLCYVPNDPDLGLQYHLAKIQAFNAYSVNTTTARGDTNVVIGITDTGTDTTHDDLRNNIKYNYADPVDGSDNDLDGYTDNFIGWDLGDNDNNPNYGASAHGVHVCGIAAASGDNAIGGMGSGFHCKFLPVKIANASGVLIAAYEGIQYAAAHNCDVINCSWGGLAAAQFQQDIVTYATINKNSLVVAAAGNNGLDMDFYPASLQYVISVANTNANDSAYLNTNYGYNIDVCAPGTAIYSTWPGDSYTVETGTSMASPVAAGAAAVIKSFYPMYTALQVGERMKATCDNIYPINASTFMNKLGNGRINMFNALTAVNTPSIVTTQRLMVDGNDDIFTANDTIQIRGTYVNYLAPTSNVTATLTAVGSSSTFINILDGTTTLGAIGTLGSANNNADPFVIRVLPTVPSNTVIQFLLTFNDVATSYSHTEYFTVLLNADYVNIAINDVATTLTSTGRIGYKADGEAGGLGFNYMNNGTLLFEGGLMIGVDTTKVSNVVRGVTASSNTDFESVVKAHQVIPAVYSEFDADATIDDIPSATGPLPVTVSTKAFAWSTAGNTKYVIFQYMIHNTGSGILNNLYAGIFADWDIDASTAGSNRASFDAGNKMGYAYSTAAGGKYAGIKLLTATAPVNHYAIDNVSGGAGAIDLYSGGFDIKEKYYTLSTSRANAGVAGTGGDVCDVVSSGPFTINPGDSVKVAFAMLAGDSLVDLQTSAVNAQTMFDGLAFVSVKENKKNANDLVVYPNPATGLVNLRLTLNEAALVELKIYDMFGRELKTIASEKLASGVHQFTEDVSGWTNGVYYYKLSIGGKISTYKLLLAK